MGRAGRAQWLVAVVEARTYHVQMAGVGEVAEAMRLAAHKLPSKRRSLSGGLENTG